MLIVFLSGNSILCFFRLNASFLFAWKLHILNWFASELVSFASQLAVCCLLAPTFFFVLGPDLALDTTLRPEEVILTPPLTHEMDTWFPHGGLPQVDM